MKDTKIQTLHPDADKINKLISLEKYEVIRSAILDILQKGPLSHTDLMEAIHQHIHGHFSGNAQWYGETVKLDLEARNVIQRSKAKPPLYSLVSIG
ncbi:DUF6958 family protein [Mucilaginibacter psychrotolerans]|uniref:HTH HARE-type domain-containing protein n=1 Tax=Mucilaginibacter psychrotolerans TaxID=1524096 RepID=A0A4Y8SNZ4_9SPHI|nr:hypothetical protein [Mucilaginibacter psychrotolerans]TFF40793.1 hypothetical protein E2R66_01030 [Mucilaginibacter psychrotolerans]